MKAIYSNILYGYDVGMLRANLTFAVTTVSFVLLLTLVAAAQAPVPPAGWRQVAACQVSFYVPHDVHEVQERGFDTCIQRFRGENVSFLIDYGRLSAVPPSRGEENIEDRQESSAILDGQNARIYTFIDKKSEVGKWAGQSTIVFFEATPPRQRINETTGPQLYIRFSVTPGANPETVKQIIQSIRFIR